MFDELRDVSNIHECVEGAVLFVERGIRFDHHRVQYLVYFSAKGAKIDNVKRYQYATKPFI